MHDTHPKTFVQDEANYELLRGNELGVLLTRAYLGAVNHDLRLAEVPIVELPADSHHTAMARPSWHAENRSGHHEVHLRLQGIDEVLDHYEEALAIRPEVAKYTSDLLHINSSDATPQLFYVFSMLHEMGHASDFFRYQDNPDKYRAEKRCAEASLPLGRVSTRIALDPSSDLHGKIAAQPDLLRRHKVGEVHELVALNNIAYRKMPHEQRADFFAVEVFQRNPALLDQLIRKTIEPYRNYPGFGNEPL